MGCAPARVAMPAASSPVASLIISFVGRASRLLVLVLVLVLVLLLLLLVLLLLVLVLLLLLLLLLTPACTTLWAASQTSLSHRTKSTTLPRTGVEVD